jgi:6,7-dimethyl-8-ribityllumazine synthase
MKSKILIVSARYYKDFSKSLELYAISILKLKKVKYKIVSVPGVFEIPVVISKNVKKYDGFIALGCVIKGETPHFDFISQATTDAIMKLSIDYKKPIGNGIITSLNKLQAANRSKKKGGEAANAVIKVLDNF